MKYAVMLSIQGKQTYLDQEPDTIELVTEGVMEQFDDGTWQLSYEESELTGLLGVITTFQIAPDRIVLDRTGRLSSQMIFQEGVFHTSLYQTEFGALMVTVCANCVKADLSPEGGTVELVYGIEIEQSTAGVIEYHLSIKTKA